MAETPPAPDRLAAIRARCEAAESRLIYYADVAAIVRDDVPYLLGIAERVERLEAALEAIASMAGSHTISVPDTGPGFGSIYREARAALSSGRFTIVPGEHITDYDVKPGKVTRALAPDAPHREPAPFVPTYPGETAAMHRAAWMRAVGYPSAEAYTAAHAPHREPHAQETT